MGEAKSFAAVGVFAESEEGVSVAVPESIDEITAALNELVDRYEMGEVISEEDQAIVKAYLPVVGTDECSLSADNSLVGEGQFEYDLSESGCDLHVKGALGCKGVGENRIEWWGDMSVAKTGGDTAITNFEFTFRGACFGVGPTGVMKMIYKREFTRDFNASEAASGSFFDRYTLTQWGFYFTGTCKLSTSKGDIVVS